MSSSTATSSSALGAVLAAIGGMIIFFLIIGIILYILGSLGFYSMCKNKGLNNPWMAWIPYLRDYKKGELLNDTVSIAGLIIPAAKWILVLAPIALSLLLNIQTDNGIVRGILSLITIAYYVYYMAANYRLYKLYKPESATVYTVVNVILPFLGPIFVFILRHNEPQEYLDIV
ncbi:MAG: hypothetical protein IJG85_04670 [Eubacteriaceae bacterium]|nr:hypothetical protein [Eubacteriaceae bacterium]